MDAWWQSWGGAFLLFGQLLELAAFAEEVLLSRRQRRRPARFNVHAIANFCAVVSTIAHGNSFDATVFMPTSTSMVVARSASAPASPSACRKRPRFVGPHDKRGWK
ncbi:hypothetical protein [Burkholderia sp. MS455]|uniref:hypothetical protein n=1 Tax=Burkholderia sp. MS455 TaxID=2811788 RepID=UPI0019589C45|nr:hypothetical protein [Burkholderia sp. MS455]